MPDFASDLLIRAHRLVCPATGRDGPGAVAIRGDRIVAVGADPGESAAAIRTFPHGILLPGLIDLHAHPARAGSVFGVDPDATCLLFGVTTVLSQGDAGAANWESYRQMTIAPSRTRVCMALNLANSGESKAGGCFADPSAIDVAACIRTIETDTQRLIWGIAVNVSHHACGSTDPRFVLDQALRVAEQTGRPLLYGMRRPEDWSFAEQLQRLRPGDVVTYCYRREPHCIVVNGRVHPAVRAARERGILFDVGHGMGSFDFATAEAAIADGFPPDTISTDLQARHRGRQPPHSLPHVMAKLRAAGMPEAEVFRAVTARPAQILGMESEIGILAPGACADLTVLQWSDEDAQLEDTHGQRRSGGCWRTVLTVRAGRIASIV